MHQARDDVDLEETDDGSGTTSIRLPAQTDDHREIDLQDLSQQTAQCIEHSEPIELPLGRGLNPRHQPKELRSSDVLQHREHESQLKQQ
jgi:hypothetical protein